MFSGRQILKNTLLLTAAALLLRFASMLFQAHLAGRIGAEGLGAVQLLLSVFAFATTLGLAGMRVAASCLCAQAHGRREPAQVQLAAAHCLGFVLVTSTLAAAGLYWAAPVLAGRVLHEPAAVGSLRLLAGLLPAGGAGLVLGGYLTAVGKVWQLTAIDAGERVLGLGLSLLLLRFAPQTVSGACFALLGGELLSSCAADAALYALYRQSWRGVRQTDAPGMARRVGALAAPLALNDLLRAALRALEQFRQMRVVPFDVPGHKRGRGNPELTAFLGQQCVGVDVNSMKPLDNLCHPVSVIREAEELAADAFGAAHAFLMVGGTTSSVQSMVLTACKRGDEIILPRNVHRSVLNALVLCGAVPVYVNPEVDKRLGISLGMKREQVAKAIKEHPNAVAVLVNNPTYYGICSDLRAIVKMAHEAGMLCLADEAHGTHFYFGNGLPVSAMAAGADMASVSMHKSGGSLTQSSLLLIGPNVHQGYVRQIINLTQTTSGSYLLMSSLDISRRNLALRGRQVFHQVADMAEYAREEINAVGGYYAFGKELCNGNSVFDFDTTKLSVHTLDIGLAGIEVYDILRDEYDIQIEFGDIGNILAYLSIGDRPQEVERLVSALAEIKRRYRTDGSGLLSQEYIDPVVAASPQEAFYAPKKSLPLRETEGMVCSEFVMCYPPGIPILAPGERITKEILNYIEYAKAKGCSMTGPEDPDILHLNVLA